MQSYGKLIQLSLSKLAKFSIAFVLDSVIAQAGEMPIVEDHV